MDAPALSRTSCHWTGSDRAATSRAASASASFGPSTLSAITTNSSPPMRPTTSPVRTAPDRRAPTWRSMWSPFGGHAGRWLV
jgi:hypothetical protein